MRNFFLSNEEYRSFIYMTLFGREAGIEPILIGHLENYKSKENIIHHMIPELGGGLWPSIMHMTTKYYHGFYPKSTTYKTSISIRDSFILREGLHQLIERGLRKASKTDDLWITEDDTKQVFTKINKERFGKDGIYAMECMKDLTALEVWRDGFVSQGGDGVESQMSFKSRLETFSEKIEFLRNQKSVLWRPSPMLRSFIQ
jgi:hypothetical protein